MGRRGPEPLPSIERRRATSISLAPFHHYTIEKLRSTEESKAEFICRLLEKSAAEAGISKEEFLQREDRHDYEIGTVTVGKDMRFSEK